MSEQNREEENVVKTVEDEEMKIENEIIDSFAYEAKEKITFIDTLKSSAIDIVSTGIISIAALYIFDILLRITAGYYVKEKVSMLFIFYLISSLLYTSIMENKSADTIGKRVSRIRITK